MRLASRSLSRETEAHPGSNDGPVPLIGNSLYHSLEQFRAHHNQCTSRRRASRTVEIQLETRRTELLAKKYLETVRQDHQQNSACVGLAPVNNPAQSTTPASSTSLASVSASSSLVSTPTPSTSQTTSSSGHSSSISSNLEPGPDGKDAVATNPATMATGHELGPNSSSMTCALKSPSIPSSSPRMSHSMTPPADQKPRRSSLSGMLPSGSTVAGEKTAGGDSGMGDIGEVHVKIEPGTSSSNSPATCSKARSSSSQSCSMSVTKSASKVNRRRSKELSRPATLAPSLLTDDSNNDLALTAHDIFTGKIGTPLLQPLEEGEDTCPLPPASSSPAMSTSSTPSSASHSSSNGSAGTLGNSLRGEGRKESLKDELDAFSKVLNAVEIKERAKESTRASLTPAGGNRYVSSLPPTSVSIQDHTPQRSHLMSSPPPYSPSQSSLNFPGSAHSQQQTQQQPQQQVMSSYMGQPRSSYAMHNPLPTMSYNSSQPGYPSTAAYSTTGHLHNDTNSHYPACAGTISDPLATPHQQHSYLPVVSSSHSQLISILRSPICTQSPTLPHPSTPTTPYSCMNPFPSHPTTSSLVMGMVNQPSHHQPLNHTFHHQQQQQQQPSGYRTPHQALTSAVPGTPGGWADPNTGAPFDNSLSQAHQSGSLAGLKRSSIGSSQYAPSTKMVHSSVPLLSNGPQLSSGGGQHHYPSMSTGVLNMRPSLPYGHYSHLS